MIETRLQLETRQQREWDALISDSRDNEIYELGKRHGIEVAEWNAKQKICPKHGVKHSRQCPKCAEKAAFRKEQNRKAKEGRKA